MIQEVLNLKEIMTDYLENQYFASDEFNNLLHEKVIEQMKRESEKFAKNKLNEEGRMESQFTHTREAIDKIDRLFSEINKNGDFQSLNPMEQAILYSPMMYLAMMINLDDDDWGHDLYHALHAIYHDKEEDKYDRSKN